MNGHGSLSTILGDGGKSMPEILRTVAALRALTGRWRAAGEASALVPTMGALHEGHLTLVRAAQGAARRVVASIFVNPRQFGANEDLSGYPRDEDGDIAKLAGVNTDAVYVPPPEEMYAAGFALTVHMTGPAKAGLEDKFRPHFFDGVATVVAKLFTQARTDYAFFGEKDYQQLCVVTRMARDLDLPITVLGVPTVREPDGLALSSRNRYLSKPERLKAPALNRVLRETAERIIMGMNPSAATAAARRSLTAQGFRVDYVAARHAETLDHPASADDPLRLLAAATLGKTRLIDNIPVVAPDRPAPPPGEHFAVRPRRKIKIIRREQEGP
jgi:pantoate--beta-alanine ligase